MTKPCDIYDQSIYDAIKKCLDQGRLSTLNKLLEHYPDGLHGKADDKPLYSHKSVMSLPEKIIADLIERLPAREAIDFFRLNLSNEHAFHIMGPIIYNRFGMPRTLVDEMIDSKDYGLSRVATLLRAGANPNDFVSVFFDLMNESRNEEAMMILDSGIDLSLLAKKSTELDLEAASKAESCDWIYWGTPPEIIKMMVDSGYQINLGDPLKKILEHTKKLSQVNIAQAKAVIEILIKSGHQVNAEHLNMVDDHHFRAELLRDSLIRDIEQNTTATDRPAKNRIRVDL